MQRGKIDYWLSCLLSVLSSVLTSGLFIISVVIGIDLFSSGIKSDIFIFSSFFIAYFVIRLGIMGSKLMPTPTIGSYYRTKLGMLVVLFYCVDVFLFLKHESLLFTLVMEVGLGALFFHLLSGYLEDRSWDKGYRPN